MDWHAMLLLGAYHGINPGTGLAAAFNPDIARLLISMGVYRL
jgi:hypothetical protein